VEIIPLQKETAIVAINYQSIAQKLKQARELQSIMVETVSEETGITVDRIHFIEAGQARPSGDEVLILANYYRHDLRDFLDDKRPAPFEQTDLLYRRHGNDFSPNDRRSIQEFLYLCEIESELESDLDIEKLRFPFFPQGKYYKGHGENAARALRAFLGYAPNEIPRNVFADFRKIGCHVFRRRLENSDISGLYIEHPIAGHCLLVNYDEDIYRQRFSVGHEAAHAIFDSSDSVVVSFRHREGRYSQADLKEIRANRFASCYLMPPDQLPSVSTWTTDQAIHWAQQFRVSTESLSYALMEAKLIDKRTAQVIRSVKVHSSEKIDPEAPESLTDRQKVRRLELLKRGLSTYYVNLCFEAHQRDLISAGRLGEAFLADHAETREISILFGRAIQYDA